MTTSTPNRVTTGKLLAIAVLLAALTASLMLAAKPAHASTTFTVNSTGDKNDLDFPGGVFDGASDGKCFTGDILVVQGEECTLRAAIQEANATSGADIIEFDLPTTGVATITPESELPKITGPVTINGHSQPGAQPNTKAIGSDAVLKIELSGAASGRNGLIIAASNSTVKGLVVNSWSQGIRIDGSGARGIKVVGNFIGTDASGTQDLGNGVGIRVYEGSNNTIGGATPAARNVISGNNGNGVGIGDGGGAANGNKVLGNYIGTDATGMKDLGNAYDGVGIEGTAGIDNASNNTIGGTTAAERNVISGNDRNGISIYASGNKVMGNYVGTDASGTKGIGNFENGVYINGANNVVGGTTVSERNVISNTSAGSGVAIDGPGAAGNKVMGNYIGTDKNGAATLGSYSGVYIENAANNTVGGTTSGVGNVISGNLTGVAIYGDGATGNRVLSNSIFSNGGLGIDLGADGPTANDPNDSDTGPNNLQNKPLLSSAKKGATGTTTVRGTLNSTPGNTFNVQFFSNPEGTDEGKTLLGSKSVTTNGTGNVSFTFSTTKAIRLGQNITATATNTSTGDTSEFSAPRKVVAQ